MKNKIIIVVALVIGFSLYLNYFSNSDRKEINKILVELEQNLEYKKVLPPLTVLSRLRKIKAHLSANFTAKSVGESNVRELGDPESIKGKALMASRYFSNIDILKLPSLVEVKGKSASTSFKATVNGQDNQGVSFKELFEIKIDFIKTEGTWYCLSIIAVRLTPSE